MPVVIASPISLLWRWAVENMLDGSSGMDGNFDVCGGCKAQAYNFSEIEHDSDCVWVKTKEFLDNAS